MRFGRSIRWKNDYTREVEFSKANGFDFMQIWYYQGDLVLDQVTGPKEIVVKNSGYPVIIHALLDINEFEVHIPRILRILKYLEHQEVIIHPVCKSEQINEHSIIKLAEKVAYANKLLSEEGITLMLENNSKLDPIHYKTEEVAYMFFKNPELQFLLDVAHIDSYQHLEEMIGIRKPRMLHVADKRFSCIHEHLPIGHGELDFQYIFRKALGDFDGSMVLEIVGEDSEITNSLHLLQSLVRNRT